MAGNSIKSLLLSALPGGGGGGGGDVDSVFDLLPAG